MGVDAVRVRSLDDVVLVFFEPERDFTPEELQRWLVALEAEGVTKSLVMSVGPLRTDPNRRRIIIDLLERRRIRIVAVTDHRFNRGLIGMFSWLGVSITGYPWSRLEDAARDVGSRPELVSPIVRAALTLRAESPAAVGLDPDDG